MPRIPMGNEAGLGTAQYSSSVSTPVLGRPVAQEVGPSRQVNKLDVVEKKTAPLSEIKPILPSQNDFIGQGLDRLAQHAEQLAAKQQEEIRKVNEAVAITGLHVSTGEQKTAYEQNTMDILNNADLSTKDKAEYLQKTEDEYKATISATDAKYQPYVSQIVSGVIGHVKIKAADVFLKNQQDVVAANLEKSREQIILDAATSGDIPGALANHAGWKGAYPRAGLTTAHFTADHIKLEQVLNQNDIMGQLKSVDVKSGPPALDAVTNLLSRLTEADDKGVPKNWTRLDPATRNSDIAAIITKKNQIEADLLANSNKQLTQLKSNFSVGMAYYSDALKNGDPIPPNLSVNLHNQAQAMMQLDPDKSAGVMGLLHIQKVEQEFGPGYRATESAKDPLFGTGVRPISFMDTSTPDALQAKFAENIKVGQMVKDAKSLTFIPVLRAADMEGISKTVESNPAAGIKMIETLGQALGKDGKNSLMVISGQMANIKDQAAPAVAAIIYNVAKGDTATAQAVASGMEVIRNKSITMPKEGDLRSKFNDLIGDAMAETSANRGVNFEVYKTVYAGMAARKNLADGNFDKTTAEDAFKRVVGSVTKWNGSRVLVPDGWEEGKFRDYLHSISPETVLSWGGIHGMTNEKAADFIKDNARLMVVSPGRYSVLYEGRQAVTQGGKQFIIDVNAPLVKPLTETPYPLAVGGY